MSYASGSVESKIVKGVLSGLLSALMLLVLPHLAMAQEQQETVCIQCHSGLPDKFSQPVKLWRGSIHAENGIACNACHGGDPKDAANAMSPSRGFLGVPKDEAIPAFCGRCHIGVMKDYLTSAHGKALGMGGPNCVTCHGNHQVLKATLELINEKSCTRCHSFDRAQIIKTAMQDTENMIIAIDARTKVFKGQGIDTEKLEQGLFAVRNRFHTLFHDVDVEKVRKESYLIQSELKNIDSTLKGLDDARQKRKIAGAVAVSAMLLLALVAHLLRKTYED